MALPIAFACDIENNFHGREELVRAFTYTDYSIEPHLHDFYEINIITAGTGVHIIEDNRVFVQTGDVFVIVPKCVHAYESTKGLNVFHILLRPEFFGLYTFDSAGAAGFELLTNIEPFLRQKTGTPFYLHLSPVQLLELQPDFDIITEKGDYDLPGLTPLKNHTAAKLLYLFARLLLLQTHETSAGRLRQKENAVVAALEYIHRNYARRITIEDLCRHTMLSRTGFMRSFKEICGCTAMEYLQLQRVKAALRLLRQGEKSKTEIANECGFYDLSHMEKALRSRQTHGAPPPGGTARQTQAN